jgi:cytochrome c oxidase subunit 4
MDSNSPSSASSSEAQGNSAARSAAYRRGILVFVGLAILTAAEFGVALLAGGSPVFLFVIALAKAGIIVQYYMHLGRLTGEEEAHT